MRTPPTLTPSICTSTPSTAAVTMNSEFWMLRPAITRDSSDFGVRLWMSANSGTTNTPVNRPIPVRSTAMRQPPGACRNCAIVRPVAGGRPGRAKYRSSRKAVMPNAPSGTRPISTVRAESFSHSSEPTPTPTENRASAKMYSVVSLTTPPRYTSA